jgi:ABC-type Zn uptake system ZnuABC Zn-binding protein ZnuA
MASVAEANLIFVNGFGLEEGLAEDLAQVADDVPIVSISEGVETLVIGSEDAIEAEAEGHEHEGEEHEGEEHEHEGEEHEHEGEEHEHEGEEHEREGEEHEHEHKHGGVDPHIWFDPVRVMVWVENAAHALSSLDANNQDLYETNAEAYLLELSELDAWIRDQVGDIPVDQRLLVTDHKSFTYFADRYGFTIIGAVIPAYSTSASSSAREIAELNDLITEHQVPAIFVGTTANSQLAESIAQDTGIEVVPLFTGSLGTEGGSADSYIGMMSTNVSAIVEALSQ